MKVAVVTGSNKGLGFGIVRALCKKFDGDVFLTSRNEARGKEAIAALEKEGLQPKLHLLDINCEESIIKLRDFLKTTYGGRVENEIFGKLKLGFSKIQKNNQ